MLLKYGADIYYTGTYTTTPLNFTKNETIIEILKKKDMEIQDFLKNIFLDNFLNNDYNLNNIDKFVNF